MISKRATLVLVSEVKKARRATSSELKAVMMEHGIEVSACTIRCQLNREGFKSQVAIKKPKLTPDMMKRTSLCSGVCGLHCRGLEKGK